MKKEWVWPAGIIASFAIFIAFMMTIWFFYNSQRIDLVTQNYYERQIQYQGQIDRITRTRNLPEPVRLTYSSEQRQIEIQFPFQFQPEQVEGTVTFYRPSNSSMDYVLPIVLSTERKQIIFTRNLAAGLWRIKMSWQSEGLDYYHEEMMLL
jgi:hypothetical protein